MAEQALGFCSSQMHNTTVGTHKAHKYTLMCRVVQYVCTHAQWDIGCKMREFGGSKQRESEKEKKQSSFLLG